MKRMKRWLGIMMSIMLAAGSLQVPVYAAETGETAVEAEIAAEDIISTDFSESEEDYVEEILSEEANPTDDYAEEEVDIEENIVSVDTQYQIKDDDKGTVVDAPDFIMDEIESEEVSEAQRGSSSIIKQGSCGKGVEYTLYDDGTLVISGNGEIKDYTFTGMPWYENRDSITSIIIESGVTRIGSSAFNRCNNLQNVSLVNGLLSIGYQSFAYCVSLGEIDIPSSVNDIDTWAFYECTALECINVDDENSTYQSNEGVLYRKAPKELLVCPMNKKTEKLYILEGTETVIEYAISGYINLTEVVLPDSLTTLGNRAFIGCKNLVTVSGGENVSSIGSKAFSNCEKLENITISPLVSEVPQEIFWGCKSLASIVLPNSVTAIRAGAFAESGITSIVIPASVNLIESNILNGCEKLTEIYFAGDAPSIRSDAFRGVNADAYYLASNSTWTDSVLQQYYGTLTWIPYQNAMTITLNEEDKTRLYTGSEIQTTPIVRGINGNLLVENQDYTLSYLDNIEPGTATIIATGIGDYAGQSASVEFTIKASIEATLPQNLYYFDSSTENYQVHKPQPIVTSGGLFLSENTDYTVEYKNNTSPGKATVTVKGIENYTGTVELPFYLAAVSGLEEYEYTGEDIIPNFSLTADKKLSIGADYTVSYENNINPGPECPQIIVTGAGDYSGEMKIPFTIKPRKVLQVTSKTGTQREINVKFEDHPCGDGYIVRWRYQEDDEDKDPEERTIDFKSMNVENGSKKESFEYTTDEEGEGWCEYHGDSMPRAKHALIQVCAYKDVQMPDGTVNRVMGDFSDDVNTPTGNQVIRKEMWGFDNPEMLYKYEHFLKLFSPEPALEWYLEGGGGDPGGDPTINLDMGKEALENITDEEKLKLIEQIFYAGYDNLDDQNNATQYVQKDGQCFGVVAAAIASYIFSSPDERLFGTRSLHDIISADMADNSYGGSESLSAGESIRYAQQIQYYKYLNDMNYSNKNNAYGIVMATKDCQNGMTSPICIGISFNYDNDGILEGHALEALGISEETPEYCKIALYDCNCEDTEECGSLILFKDSKGFFNNKWEWELGEHYNNATIRSTDDKENYITYFDENAMRFVADQLLAIKDATNQIEGQNLIHIQFQNDEIENIENLLESWDVTPINNLRSLDQESSVTDVYCYLDDSSLDLNSVPKNTRIAVTDIDRSIIVESTEIADYKFEFASIKNTVAARLKADGLISVKFRTSNAGSYEATEEWLYGLAEANRELILSQHNNSIEFSGMDTMKFGSFQGKRDHSSGILIAERDVEVPAKIIDDVQVYSIYTQEDTLIIKNKNDSTGEVLFMGEYKDVNESGGSASEVTASGDLTDTVFWKLDEDGVLTVSGEGEMPDFGYSDPAPWKHLRYDISEIIIENGITSIGSDAFYFCENCNSVTIPESVRKIGYNAFRYCKSLRSVIIPNGVTHLGAFAFAGCNSLESVTIPDSVNRIGEYTFWNCEVLTDVILGSGMTSIPNWMFSNCTALEAIIIPEGVESLGQGAFSRCTSLGSIELSENLKQVYENAFLECSGLEYVAYYGTKAQWKQVRFESGNTDLWIGTIHCSDGDLNVTLPGKTTRGDMFNLANNVKVTWKEVPGAKYYKVYREGVTDQKESRKEPVIITSGLVGWDKELGLTNGHAYRYKIVASLTGKGDSSGDSTLSYSKLMYRLKTVVIRSVKNTAPGKVTVKYDKTTSGDSYVLQYCERQDMVGAKTKVVLGANNTSYVIGGLKKGKTYYISIRVRKKVNGIDYYTTFGVPKKITITK